MATPNYTEEEIQFRKRARRRLVGAVVLVALVVAVVPLILPESKPQQDTQQIDIRIPSQDASGYAPKIMPALGVGLVASLCAKLLWRRALKRVSWRRLGGWAWPLRSSTAPPPSARLSGRSLADRSWTPGASRR